MLSTVSSRGQIAIPAAIRRRYNIMSRSRIEWIDDGHGIAIVPVAEDAVQALRGKYRSVALSSALAKSRKTNGSFKS